MSTEPGGYEFIDEQGDHCALELGDFWRVSYERAGGVGVTEPNLEELKALAESSDWADFAALIVSAVPALIARCQTAETERQEAEDRAEHAEFLYAQEREFSVDAARHTKDVREALADLCDAFQQVYEAEYGPAPASENGVYHHARKLLGVQGSDQ